MAAYYNEFDPAKAEWLRELIRAGVIAQGEVDERSIHLVRPGDLRGFTQCHFFAGIGIWSYALRLAGWPDDREIWTGSCPCQPFSAAGKREAKDDPRHLWPELFRLIAARRPVCAIGEQVASIDGLAWFDDVRTDLDGAHYTVGCVDTCAAGFGAPHIRQRLYWGARLADSERKSIRDQERGAAVGAAPDLPREGQQWERLRVDAGTDGDILGLADADSERLTRRPERGFWAGADWVLTRPQRMGDSPSLRPVKSGAFPLVTGAPARVLRLRGYGDAINAEVAAAFIRAWLAEEGA